MNALLEYQTADGMRIEKPLTKPLVSMGRGEPNDVVLDDPQVSRNHALLRGTGEDTYYLVDLGSRNGTYINGKRVVVPVLLNNADEIRVGATTLTFVLPRTAEETTAELSDYAHSSRTPTSYSLNMEMLQATVLVADIRAYTAMSEQMPLHFLAKIMSDWFRYSNDIIEKNQGFVDKFIGDAIMACWLSRGEDLKGSMKHALSAAHDLLKMTNALSQSNPSLSQPLQIGIGISTGEAIAGGFGSGRPKDYTVMGDSVNLAFRLEKAAKELKGDVAITQDSLRHLTWPPHHGCEKSVDVKGKQDPVPILLLKFDELAAILSSS